jgi:hypothetical protein
MKEEALLICCQLPAEAELSRILPKFHMLTGRVDYSSTKRYRRVDKAQLNDSRQTFD